MPDQPTEVRCPRCAKLMLVVSVDFAGTLSTRCGRCRLEFPYPSDGAIQSERLTCACAKWLACGTIEAGYIQAACTRERVLVRLTPGGAVLLEPPLGRKGKRVEAVLLPVTSRPIATDVLVTLVEERWALFQARKAHRRVEIAVGLRFDVFARDGFRCRYCGRGADQGVLLEADHVVARSAGGPDTLANLVTACEDCNRGKAAKVLLTPEVMRINSR